MGKDFLNNPGFLVGKYLIYQVSKEVPVTAKKYTYTSAGGNYLLETIKIDVTTGKISNVKFPYLIEDNTKTIGKDNIEFDHVALYVSKITDKLLSDSNHILFDQNLKPVANLNKLEDVIGVLEGNYYNIVSREVLDKDLNVVLNLEDVSVGIHHQINGKGYFSFRHNGLYGLIDYKGKIVIAPKYKQEFYFTNGVSLNRNELSKDVLIGITQSETELKVNEQKVGTYLIKETTTSGIKYRTIDGKVIATLDGVMFEDNQLFYDKLGKPLGMLLIVQTNTEVKYYVIK